MVFERKKKANIAVEVEAMTNPEISEVGLSESALEHLRKSRAQPHFT